MDFLKDAALPQSTGQFQLLLLILNLVYVVFLPYFGFLLGSAVLSLIAEHARAAGKWTGAGRLAREVLDFALNSGAVVAFLGVLPSWTMLFLYAQLLHETGAISVGLMGYGALAFLAGTLLLLAYRDTYRLEPLADSYDRLMKNDPAAAQELRELNAYARSSQSRRFRLGLWGASFLGLSSLLTIGAMTTVLDHRSWGVIDTMTAVSLSTGFFLKYLQFMAVAAGATGLGILFFFFVWEGGRHRGDSVYRDMVRRIGVSLAMFSALAQPALIVLNIVVLPDRVLSGGLFGLAGASLLLFFLTAQFLYAYGKASEGGYLSYAFYTLGVALLLLFTADQVAVGNATRPHAARLAVEYDRSADALRARLGVSAASMSGEDIYNAKCSACHLMDQKKVGPPYQTVIPKYAGDKAKLIAFVLNPVKVDPAYPPMPNQGLRPAEADSIATFLLSKMGITPKPPAAAAADSAG
jgi:cytochrome c